MNKTAKEVQDVVGRESSRLYEKLSSVVKTTEESFLSQSATDVHNVTGNFDKLIEAFDQHKNTTNNHLLDLSGTIESGFANMANFIGAKFHEFDEKLSYLAKRVDEGGQVQSQHSQGEAEYTLHNHVLQEQFPLEDQPGNPGNPQGHFHTASDGKFPRGNYGRSETHRGGHNITTGGAYSRAGNLSGGVANSAGGSGAGAGNSNSNVRRPYDNFPKLAKFDGKGWEGFVTQLNLLSDHYAWDDDAKVRQLVFYLSGAAR